MFDKFIDKAREVLKLARLTAEKWNHEYIGTEHLLVGVINVGGIGAEIISHLGGADLKDIEAEIKQMTHNPHSQYIIGSLPFTPMAKRVLEYAVDEAYNQKEEDIGVEHLLAGLIQDHGTVAQIILTKHGLTLEKIRQEIKAYRLGKNTQKFKREIKATIFKTNEDWLEFIRKSNLSLINPKEFPCIALTAVNAEPIFFYQPDVTLFSPQ